IARGERDLLGEVGEERLRLVAPGPLEVVEHQPPRDRWRGSSQGLVDMKRDRARPGSIRRVGQVPVAENGWLRQPCDDVQRLRTIEIEVAHLVARPGGVAEVANQVLQIRLARARRTANLEDSIL